jgi:pimeloyl-ACP methyl ester carboxylesterase
VAGTASAHAADAVQYVLPTTTPVECTAERSGFGGTMTTLPGYRVRDPSGEVCVPFAYRARFPPAGYRGDYYVDEFTDAKVKAAYRRCKADPTCAERSKALRFAAPGHQYRATGTLGPVGKIDPHGAADLKQIRRPAFFGRAPYHEPIAEAEGRTYTVEFAAPAEPHERIHLGRAEPVHLRGWYLEGQGVDDGAGQELRALVVLIGGRSIETTAVQTPGEPFGRDTPTATTEAFGAATWRNSYIYAFNKAGFDVLTFDKRGHGVSGGHNDTNTLEQGRDMLRALAALGTGEGLRLLTPGGEVLAGAAAGGRLLAGKGAKEIPVILGGSSQGSMTTVWAMHANLIGDCSYALPQVSCTPPLGYNVKGAMLLAPFEGGIGNGTGTASVDDSAAREGRSRVEDNIVTLPSSEPLANIGRWPAVFFGKGLWDFAEALEATYQSYQRVEGLKELVVVRGGHSEVAWGAENVAHVVNRMIAFAKAAVRGASKVPGAPQFGSLKELVASSPPTWEPGSYPGRLEQGVRP